jgi:DNA-binding transcriptional MerR regulator
MPKNYSIADETKKLYSTGELAQEIDRTAQTIRLWERKGIIPKAPLIFGNVGFSKQGRRLYNEQHKNALKLLTKKHNVKSGIKMSEDFIKETFKTFEDIANNKEPAIFRDDSLVNAKTA